MNLIFNYSQSCLYSTNILIALFLLALFSGSAYAVDQDLDLTIEKDHFTLQAKNVPLNTVLQMLEKKGVLQVRGTLRDNPRINLDIQNLNLLQTLAAIRQKSPFGYGLQSVQNAPPILWLFSGQGNSPSSKDPAANITETTTKLVDTKPPPSSQTQKILPNTKKPSPKPSPIQFNFDPASLLPSQ